jgi:DNA-binding HxlR family transcriptional regulator
LSELGDSLRPVINVLAEWGTAYKTRWEKSKTKINE